VRVASTASFVKWSVGERCVAKSSKSGTTESSGKKLKKVAGASKVGRASSSGQFIKVTTDRPVPAAKPKK